MMTPEDIRTCLEAARNQLHPLPLQTRDGYSFWYGAPAHTNRILRVSRQAPGSATKLKLAVSDRLADVRAGQPTEFTFNGTQEDLLSYVDREIELYVSRIAAS
jgi:hypothetical protein